jgi:hypothetical protein
MDWSCCGDGLVWQRLLASAFKLGFPATGATIAAAAGSGSCAGVLLRVVGPAASAAMPVAVLQAGPAEALRMIIAQLTSTSMGGAAFGSLSAVVRRQQAHHVHPHPKQQRDSTLPSVASIAQC